MMSPTSVVATTTTTKNGSIKSQMTSPHNNPLKASAAKLLDDVQQLHDLPEEEDEDESLSSNISHTDKTLDKMVTMSTEQTADTRGTDTMTTMATTTTTASTKPPPDTVDDEEKQQKSTADHPESSEDRDSRDKLVARETKLLQRWKTMIVGLFVLLIVTCTWQTHRLIQKHQDQRIQVMVSSSEASDIDTQSRLI